MESGTANSLRVKLMWRRTGTHFEIAVEVGREVILPVIQPFSNLGSLL
jgi:hypothetical protein